MFNSPESGEGNKASKDDDSPGTRAVSWAAGKPDVNSLLQILQRPKCFSQECPNHQALTCSGTAFAHLPMSRDVHQVQTEGYKCKRFLELVFFSEEEDFCCVPYHF